MPYNADLRSSYFSLELNMSWFYESLSEMNEEIDFKPTYCFKSDTEESAIKHTISAFERHIEVAFKDWTVYKVFGHQKGDHEYENYEIVWEFLRDVAIDYTQNNHAVVIVDNTLDTEESE
jgi:hypothetical protein